MQSTLHALLPKAVEKARERRPSEHPSETVILALSAIPCHYTYVVETTFSACHPPGFCLNEEFTGRYGNRILDARNHFAQREFVSRIVNLKNLYIDHNKSRLL